MHSSYEHSGVPGDARLTSAQVALAEVEMAAMKELGLPIQKRDHKVLRMLEHQRQKLALSVKLDPDGSTAHHFHDSPVGLGHQETPVVSLQSSTRTLRIVTVGGLGDAILVTPALRALAAANPNRRLVIWGDPMHESIFRHNPCVTTFRPVRRIEARIFNAVGGARWMPYLDTGYGRFLPSIIYGKSASTLISEMLNVSLQGELPELFLSENENITAAERLRQLKRPVVSIHVQARYSENKNWSLENWKELVARCPDVTFVQIGGAYEPIIEGAWDQTGNDLRDAFAILKHCDAFIGVDSVLAHATVAVGTPGVVLFGPSNPSVWGHAGNVNLYSSRYCSPCIDLLGASQCPFSKACMNEISVPVVHAALREILRQGKEKRRQL